MIKSALKSVDENILYALTIEKINQNSLKMSLPSDDSASICFVNNLLNLIKDNAFHTGSSCHRQDSESECLMFTVIVSVLLRNRFGRRRFVFDLVVLGLCHGLVHNVNGLPLVLRQFAEQPDVCDNRL